MGFIKLGLHCPWVAISNSLWIVQFSNNLQFASLVRYITTYGGLPSPQNTCKSLVKKLKVTPWICGYHGYENKLGFCRCRQSVSDLTDHFFMQLFPHKSVAIAWKKLCSVWCPHLGDSNLEASGEAKSSVGFRKALDIVMLNELIPSDVKKNENLLQRLCKSFQPVGAILLCHCDGEKETGFLSRISHDWPVEV